jgi:hypothetical protein
VFHCHSWRPADVGVLAVANLLADGPVVGAALLLLMSLPCSVFQLLFCCRCHLACAADGFSVVLLVFLLMSCLQLASLLLLSSLLLLAFETNVICFWFSELWTTEWPVEVAK